MHRVRLLPLLALAALAPATPAQDIEIRVSFKLVLGPNGESPSGPWGDPATIAAYMADTTAAMQRFGRGYGFVVDEIVPVAGISQFYDVQGDPNPALDEVLQLEAQAEADPATYAWSTTAVNVYVPDTLNGGNGGVAFVPSDSPGMEVVVLASWARDFDLLHELGHHFDLRHTFEEDFVADTLPDFELICDVPFGCVVGGTAECCCSTKLSVLQALSYSPEDEQNLLYNSMSYYGAVDCFGLFSPAFGLDTVVLTPGQLDRVADATRLYHTGEATGSTHFVDAGGAAAATGLSFDPHATVAAGVGAAAQGGGDVVVVRAGSHAAVGLYTKPVVLRGTGGPAVLGW